MKQKQNSPTSLTPSKEEELDDNEEDDNEEEEEERAIVKPKQEEKPTPKKDMTKEEQIAMEIEMLQNNGRFRVELLHQLQEINKSLYVLSKTIYDLVGDDKKD